MDLQSFLTADTFSRVVDILLVSGIIYTTLILVRGTRAQPMLVGLAIVALVYFVSRELNFVVLNWILSNFLGSVILLIVVLFQDDLRRALTKVGLFSGFSHEFESRSERTVQQIVAAVSTLAEKRTGAILVIQQDVGLGDYTEHAVEIDGVVSKQLLISIFHQESPIHDGAVVVQKDRVIAAGAVLPLSFSAELPNDLGTRHRAAIGLSEKTDALVLVVSEETGQISLVRDGKITRDIGALNLSKVLGKFLFAEGLFKKSSNSDKNVFSESQEKASSKKTDKAAQVSKK
jgi:diadenylate cyclase